MLHARCLDVKQKEELDVIKADVKKEIQSKLVLGGLTEQLALEMINNAPTNLGNVGEDCVVVFLRRVENILMNVLIHN